MSIVFINSYQFVAFDPDALTYINAVETADGQSLETGVRTAINDFVLGCKSDGIWNAIKASCILAGARTLTGALVPLVGTAPTNNNFVAGDYDRKTGLQADGTTKYLDTEENPAVFAPNQNSIHLATYISANGGTSVAGLLDTGSRGWLWIRGDTNFAANSGNAQASPNSSDVGLVGVSRSNSSNYVARSQGVSNTLTATSYSSSSLDVAIFALNQDGSIVDHGAPRLSFYSIGESLDLAKLDTRVSNLMTAIDAAIP